VAYNESAERIRAAKEALMMRQSPGAYEDAIKIAKQQGAKTDKEIESQAKNITNNRSVDAQKNLTRAKMHSANVELLKGTQAGHVVTDSKNHTRTVK
jgi:hypothetical protein